MDPIIPQPYICSAYTCTLCNYSTFVKKNLLWHNSTDAHLYKERNNPTALSVFKIIQRLSLHERTLLRSLLHDYNL